MKKRQRAKSSNTTGHQRLPLKSLHEWEKLGFGMFIHFGMSTFDGDEFSRGEKPSSLYAPDRLDVAQWVGVARDAGMKYAVLTTKHVAGHGLWPSSFTDYHVGTSGNRTDVVEAFVAACRKAGIQPGFYYCSWDNHHRFGSCTPTFPSEVSSKWGECMYTTREYEDFQYRQLEELATQYGKITEFWIDIPMILSPAFRRQLYQRLTKLQPEAVVVMNHGFLANGKVSHEAWPTDIFNYETYLPPYHVHPGGLAGHQPWRDLEGKKYYLPGEVSDTLVSSWFWMKQAKPKSDRELLGSFLLSRARGCNYVLNVSPDVHGVIPAAQVKALAQLRRNLDAVGG
jgi:alpha-L-fucosidase